MKKIFIPWSAFVFALLLGFLSCFSVLPPRLFAAQFVEQPLFLSKSPVTEGQKVRVYAIVSNESPLPFSGNVLIQENGNRLGFPTSTLAVGATQTVSTTWIPTAGDHIVTAQLMSDDGIVVQQVSRTFTIASLPPPVVVSIIVPSVNTSIPSGGSSDYRSSQPIQQVLAKFSPTIAADLTPALKSVDAVRASADGTLDSQIRTVRQALGAATTSDTSTLASTSNKMSLSPSFLTRAEHGTVYGLRIAYLIVLQTIRFLVDNPLLFYPVLIILFFYILWKVAHFFF